jgi:hypothetical protein
MGKRKVKVYVEGFGVVLVDRPKKYTRQTFADGVGEGVAGAVGLIMDRDRTSFHPVLGRGGYDWDHVAQAVDVSEAHTPVVALDARKRDIFRVRMQRVWEAIQDFAGGIRSQFHKGGS